MKRLLAIVLLTFSPVVFSADYTFDKVHTQIFFTASHLGFSNSTGAFVNFDGGFSFDENDFSQAKVEVVIQTDSIDLNDETWNKKMKGKKWFHAEKYPTMTFKSTSVKKTGEKTMDVVGDLTLKGVTKPVTLKVIVNKVGKQFTKEKAGFSAVATLDRTDFGLKSYVPAVGTEVSIRIEVEGEKVGKGKGKGKKS